MPIKFLHDIDAIGELKGTSLDINGNADISGLLLINNSGATGQGWIQGYDAYHSIKFRAGGTNKTEYYEYGGTLAAGLGHKFFTGGTSSQTLKLQIANDGSSFTGNLNVGGATTTTDVNINDTNTRLHRGTGNALRISTGTGYIDIGSMNSSWIHFQGNKPYYFNQPLSMDADLKPYSTSGARNLGATSYVWNHVYAKGYFIDSTEVIDASRNLASIGTIGSGAITSTGKITGTELEGTSLDINGSADISSALVIGGNLTSSGNQYFNGQFVEGDGKEMFRYDDAWLRINEDNDFTSGIYCGSGVLRTDGAFQVGSSGGKFLVTNAGAVTAESTLTLDNGQIVLGGTGRIQGIDTVSAGTDATSKDYVQNWVGSRGENLFSNGSGLLGDITNMPGFTFDGSHANNSSGAFKWTGTGTPFTGEFMPVDASRKVKMQYDAKTQNGGGRYYGFTACYDVDNNQIYASNHMYRANTSTTLAVQLVNGATTVTLAGTGSAWYNGGTAGSSTHLRSFIIWEYANSFGYVYPPETYSRLYFGNSWDPGDINGNVITLRVPWAGGTYPVGTRLSNGSSGGTFKYNIMSNKLLTTDWVRQSGYMDGVDYSGTNVYNKFPPGTAKIKLGWLMNYQNVQDGEIAWFTNIQVNNAASEDSEVRDAVQRASDSNTFTDADHTKLNAIESGATADQTVTNSTSTTSSTTVASATAVKAAYDRGSTGVTNAASAQTTANAALPKAGGTITGNLQTNGNTFLGNATGDYVHVNDKLYVGATDSGDSEFWFGEGTTGDVNYGTKWRWDSGYTHSWYTVNNSTETLMMSFMTNDTSQLKWFRMFDMNNKKITELATPTAGTDAATKAYVDGAVIANTDTQDLSISGQTLSLTNSPSITLPTQTSVSGNAGSVKYKWSLFEYRSNNNGC